MARPTNPHSALRRACLMAAKWTLGDEFVYFNQLGGLGTRPGTPDTLACYRGYFMAIEYKTGRGRLSPAQEAERGKILASGGQAFVIRSIDDFLFILKQLKEGKYV